MRRSATQGVEVVGIRSCQLTAFLLLWSCSTSCSETVPRKTIRRPHSVGSSAATVIFRRRSLSQESLAKKLGTALVAKRSLVTLSLRSRRFSRALEIYAMKQGRHHLWPHTSACSTRLHYSLTQICRAERSYWAWPHTEAPVKFGNRRMQSCLDKPATFARTEFDRIIQGTGLSSAV